MSELNPYAPSPATLGPGTLPPAEERVWRDGGTLVAALYAPLPDRCVKCNAPASPPTKERTVTWHHPALYLLLLVAIIYLLVAERVRKRTHLSPGLCVRHKRIRFGAILVGWLGAVAGLVVFGHEFVAQPSNALAGVGLLVVSLLVVIVFGRVVYARKIDSEHVRLGGCGRAYLAQLPQWRD